MNTVEFIEQQGMRANRPERTYNLKVKELMQFLDAYYALKIKGYRKLVRQYKETGCKNCAEAIKTIEEEQDRLIQRYT